MADTKEEVEVRYGPIPIQTPQDAVWAYLREEISEDKFREICGTFGVLPGQLLQYTNERPDAAFERTIPDDILLAPPPVKDDLESRQKAVAEKEKAREEATKAGEAKTESPRALTTSTTPKEEVKAHK